MWKLVAGSVFSYSAYCYALRPPQEIIPAASAALFAIQYTNTDTLKHEAFSTGFFISEDGVAVTSGPMLAAHKDAKILIRLRDGREFEAEPTIFPNAPGLGFLSVKRTAEAFPHIPPMMKPEALQPGDHVYTLGFLASHLFFTRLYVTDTVHRSAMKDGNTITVVNTVKTTGDVSKVCVGSPLLDEEGRAVAVVINLEMGCAVSTALSYMEKLKTEEKPSMWASSYRRVKEGLYKIMKDIAE